MLMLFHHSKFFRVIPRSLFWLTLAGIWLLPVRPLFAQEVYGYQGVVVAHDAEACQAGIEILQQGGNAVDAAVAVAYALAVTHPEAGNIGGGGFMLIHLAGDSTYALDYRETAPGKAFRDMFLNDSGRVVPGKSLVGGLAVGVPGTVAGMEAALSRFGLLSREEVMAPAIRLAREGFRVSYRLARALAWLDQRARDFPATRKLFTRSGRPYRPGEIFRQPRLARTLQRIAHMGPKAFYEGPLAEALVRAVRQAGGVMEVEDLANYRAVWRRPLHGRYRGYDIFSMPPPSSGGVALLSMLNMLSLAPLDSLEWHSAPYVQLLTEVERRVYADRSRWLGDPDFYPVPVNQLLSQSYARRRFAEIDFSRANPSREVAPLDPLALKLLAEGEETTHFCVVDRWGNAVSNTYTLNWSFGSLVSVPEGGFLLNDEMDDFSAKPGVPNAFGLLGGVANAIAPGKRMLSSMTPTIVLRDGQVFAVVGTPGGSTIITSVMQVLLNLINYRMSPLNAVSVSRFHHQWLPDVIYYEPYGLSAETRARLEKLGYVFKLRPPIGEVNLIVRDTTAGGWFGAPDFRRGSHAAGY